MEAAKKAKSKPASNPKGQKPGGKGEKDEAEEQEAKVSSKPDSIKKPEEVFDLNIPDQFERALKAKIRRPFIFGPVEFEGLNLSETESPLDSQL